MSSGSGVSPYQPTVLDCDEEAYITLVLLFIFCWQMSSDITKSNDFLMKGAVESCQQTPFAAQCYRSVAFFSIQLRDEPVCNVPTMSALDQLIFGVSEHSAIIIVCYSQNVQSADLVVLQCHNTCTTKLNVSHGALPTINSFR